MATVSKFDKYNTPAMKALHDLTPGGSEFAGDPKYCADYIRKREHSQHEMIVKLTLRVRELEQALLAERRLAYEDAAETCDYYAINSRNALHLARLFREKAEKLATPRGGE